MLTVLYIFILCFILHVHYAHGDNIGNITRYNFTRRIIKGTNAGETRPYMVYLRPSSSSKNQDIDPNWTCGGAIIHPFFVLTSAACIEDVEHFYVISGTNKWTPHDETNECIKNGATKAVWKCVAKNYNYDGDQYDNIRWMISDIAVVKVDDEFNFSKRVRGCDFIPKMIAFNNRSKDLEAPKELASLAGWGSTDGFIQPEVERRTGNSPTLLETEVVIMSVKNCKKHWPERYHYVIQENMICTEEGSADDMSDACKENEVKCKELIFSDEDNKRKYIIDPDHLNVHRPNYYSGNRRAFSRGFCENDHGGPLVSGHGTGAVIIGIITAAMTSEVTKKCYGPFLYTSVWLHRHLISCAINKNRGETCRRLLRSGKPYMTEKVFDWEETKSRPTIQTTTATTKKRKDKESFRDRYTFRTQTEVKGSK